VEGRASQGRSVSSMRLASCATLRASSSDVGSFIGIFHSIPLDSFIGLPHTPSSRNAPGLLTPVRVAMCHHQIVSSVAALPPRRLRDASPSRAPPAPQAASATQEPPLCAGL
jgi:hypothetical protein